MGLNLTPNQIVVQELNAFWADSPSGKQERFRRLLARLQVKVESTDADIGIAIGLAESIELYVQTRYPTLLALAEKHRLCSYSAEQLIPLMENLFTSDTVEEAWYCLCLLNPQ